MGVNKFFTNLRGDLQGGLSTASIAIPIAIAIGITAFAPLGPEFTAQGVTASLLAAIAGMLLSSLFGGTPGQITCPTPPMAVIVASMLLHLVQGKEFTTNEILLFISVIIAGAGLFQMLLGYLGGGKLIKYIPYPVVAGFMNGIALIFFVAQIPLILGLDQSVSLAEIFTGGVKVHYGALAAGIATIAATLIAQRFITRFPVDVIGLFFGIASFFAIGAFFKPEMLHLEHNPLIIGPMSLNPPTLGTAGTFFQFLKGLSFSQWAMLVIPALTVSVLAAIEGLLATLVVDKKTRTRSDGNRQIFGQGICNVASGLFGGLPVAAGLPETMANLDNGGRTKLSGCIASLAVFMIVLIFSPLVKWIPFSVLAGLLMLVSFRIFEFDSINLFKKRSTVESLVIVLAVTIITLSVDLVIAVCIGLLIASLLFVKEQIGQTIVRKKYTGNLVHSKTVRDPDARRILQEHGSQITVYHLSGSLFFGTCDKLLLEIENDKSPYLVFDLKRVTSIDITGTQLLLQIIERIHAEGRELFFANLDVPGDPDKVRIRKFMEDLGVIEALREDHIFPDLDLALERAENLLIAHVTRKEKLSKSILTLHNLSVFSALTPDELLRVEPYLQSQEFHRGEIIFRQGDPGDGMYFILSGNVSVILEQKESKKELRLATFAEGVFFGDMAILEDQPRSATVRSDTDTQLLFMSKNDFYKLIESEPLIANRILLGLARELAYRLRSTNAEVSTLAEQ